MINYENFLDVVRKLGMDYNWGRMFAKKFIDDLAAFETTDEQKKWAMERGFYPGRIELYGLNEDNYKNYLPDWNYFMVHPLNHHFRKWVDDKLTLKYVLNSGDGIDTMPDYYLYVENDGTYTYLMDAPKNIVKDKNFIRNLLAQKGILMMKPNSGTSGGRGIIKLELLDDIIYENNKPIDESRFKNILSHLENYIVTEYAFQHSELAAIWSESECTLRIIMVKMPRDDSYSFSEWSCIVSYARFGSSVSGGTSNLSSGGIGIGFDFNTGMYNEFGIRYKKFCEDGVWKLYEHPDTKMVWKNARLPNWTLVKKRIESICNQISSLDYLGFDVIITEDGMTICEINTHPACDYEQVMCGPIFSKESGKKFFGAKGIDKFDTTDLYKAYLMSL